MVCVRATPITSTNSPSFLQQLPFPYVSPCFSVSGLCPYNTVTILLCFSVFFSEWSVSVQHGYHFSYVSLLFSVSGLCPCDTYYLYQFTKFPATVAISLCFSVFFSEWIVSVQQLLLLPMLQVSSNSCHFSYVSPCFSVSGLCPYSTVTISLMFLSVFQ